MEEQTIEQIQTAMDRAVVITGPDKILSIECKKVAEWHPMIDNLILTMVTVMNANKGIGLAAPQVGVDLQVIVILDNDSKPMALVNPEYIYKSDETEYSMEGCLSYPGIRVPVTRASTVKVRAMIKDGEIEWELNGLEARIAQHEMDHLMGICHVDGIDSLPRRDRQRLKGELKKFNKRKRF